MEGIVIDTSVIIAVLTGEASRRALIQRTRGEILYAPSSVHYEVGNALSALMKRKRTTISQVQEILRAYKAITVQYLGVDMYDAMQISADYNLYAYDAYVLSVSRQAGLPIITLDKRLAKVAEAMALSLVDIET